MELRLNIPDGQIRKLVANVKAYERTKRRRIQLIINKWVYKIHGDAVRLAPVNKKIGLGGQLRSQIRVEIEILAAAVVAGADYSIFQELGTGRRGAASGAPAVDGYVYGGRAGIPAQAFLFPAFEKNRQGFIDELKAELKR